MSDSVERDAPTRPGPWNFKYEISIFLLNPSRKRLIEDGKCMQNLQVLEKNPKDEGSRNP